MRLTRASRPSLVSLLAAALTGGMLVGAVGGAGPGHAVDGVSCLEVNQIDVVNETPVTDVAEDGTPVDALDVEAAQQRVVELSGRAPGEGVGVAVVDSGVLPDLVDESVAPPEGATSTGALVWHQGTLIAGVVAAGPDPRTGRPIGIAPGVRIYDQRVYDTGVANDEGLLTPTSDALADGLDAIAPLVGRNGVRIVTVGVRVDDSARLREAVDRVTARGAVVVAAGGERLDEGEEAPSATYRDGEDYAELSFPAGYAAAGRDREANPLVMAVTTTAAPGDGTEDLDLTASILLSSAIDVAVPTAGAVSVGLNGELCSVYVPSTAVAAAEVTGVLAMLMTAFPRDTPRQVVARLEATASGAATDDLAPPDTRVGKGVVQPLEALDRPLAPTRDGVLPRSVVPERQATPATLPAVEPDVLASTRDNAVWWGLLGGGVLVVLVLLRPVLSRRRSA